MKKALLALFAIATVTAASAFAADKTDVPAPVVDTPAETINKLTALIPAGQAKHYEVHVEVVPVGEGTDRQ